MMLSSRMVIAGAPRRRVGRSGGGRVSFLSPYYYNKNLCSSSSSSSSRKSSTFLELFESSTPRRQNHRVLRRGGSSSTATRPLPLYSFSSSFSSSSAAAAATSVSSSDDEQQQQQQQDPNQSGSNNNNSNQKEEGNYGLYGLLKDNERQFLKEQREITELTQDLISRVHGGSKKSSSSSSSSQIILEDLSTFSIVIAGEFNAGKSTLINALLGTKLLESGALPTTDAITIVSHQNIDKNNDISSSSSSSSSNNVMMGLEMYTSSLPLLEDLTLVDTPGTNSTWLDHTSRTLNLLPAADMILFITSADRPFSESEKLLLEKIQKYRKNIVIVINKMDILDTAGGDHGKEQKQAIVDFVTDHASELLGARPIIIPISSRDALSAKLMERSTTTTTITDVKNTTSELQQRSNLWHRSNFDELESFLYESLTTTTKLKSKLISPIGVAEGQLEDCLTELQKQYDSLEEDIATLNLLKTQFTSWEKQLQQDLDLSRLQMVNQIQEQGQRCELLLAKLNIIQFHLLAITSNNRQIEQEWEETKRQLITTTTTSSSDDNNKSSLEADLLQQIQETADSIATRGRAQGQAVIEYLGKRPAMKNQSLVGSVTAASRFEDTRKLLNERLSSAVIHTFKNGEEDIEKIRLFASLKQTALLSIMFQLGAIGTTLTAISSSSGGGIFASYPTEALIAATSCAISGIATYIGGTNLVTKSYENSWQQKSMNFDSTIQAIYKKELNRINSKILDGISPYTRFVESEQERIENLQEQCHTVLAGSRNLKNKINKSISR